MKYTFLINILDKLRNEATSRHRAKYLPDELDIEKVNQARSRAYIHLFLKVLFGILEFDERENLITDNAYDGGIDGYYIDKEKKLIYLIQSKFRTTEFNFEHKEIGLEEILVMDTGRVLGGEEYDDSGNKYNGKIKQLQREISQISDVARYSYKVIILANLKNISHAKLMQLTGGYTAEVFDYQKSYKKLLLPIISGTYFTADDINIPIDLSNKNAGSKISYTVNTKFSDCEITVLFVPVLEIAKIMSKYKNSILKYNPRSFLEFQGKDVNNSIRETILNNGTNEFALFNNGITMISDETYINEKIGQKNKAQLRIKNPQIINGGQTSFTLSRIYEENIGKNPEIIFKNKEVLLKIITLIDNISDKEKLELIDEISEATNKQTPVFNADRFANEEFHEKLQSIIFENYSLLYERKRGEYSDGINNKYIDKFDVIERNLFFRLYYSANGNFKKGIQKRLFQKNDFNDIDLNNCTAFNRFVLCYRVYLFFTQNRHIDSRINQIIYYKLYIYVSLYLESGLNPELSDIEKNFKITESLWLNFMDDRRKNSTIGRSVRINKVNGEEFIVFHETKYQQSPEMINDLNVFIDGFLNSEHQSNSTPN